MVNLTVTLTAYLPMGYRLETHLATRLGCQKDLPTVCLLTAIPKESRLDCHSESQTAKLMEFPLTETQMGTLMDCHLAMPMAMRLAFLHLGCQMGNRLDCPKGYRMGLR